MMPQPSQTDFTVLPSLLMIPLRSDSDPAADFRCRVLKEGKMIAVEPVAEIESGHREHLDSVLPRDRVGGVQVK